MSFAERLRKYFIMGSQNCTRDPVKILEEAIHAGITAFQFREKGKGSLKGEEKFALGLKLRELCKKHGVLFFINDDFDLVEPLDVDGIHVGQEDISPVEIRRQYPEKIIGLSISNLEELKQSPVDFIDYIGAGPIFGTQTKKDAPSAVGLAWIRTLRKEVPHLPIVGIGGITPENARKVLEAGAVGVSFISAVTAAANIHEAVENL